MLGGPVLGVKLLVDSGVWVRDIFAILRSAIFVDALLGHAYLGGPGLDDVSLGIVLLDIAPSNSAAWARNSLVR